MTESNPDSDERDESRGLRQKLFAAWTWVTDVFHGHAGTDQIKNRKR